MYSDTASDIRLEVARVAKIIESDKGYTDAEAALEWAKLDRILYAAELAKPRVPSANGDEAHRHAFAQLLDHIAHLRRCMHLRLERKRVPADERIAHVLERATSDNPSRATKIEHERMVLEAMQRAGDQG